jgi:hypothetical protein
MDTLRLLASITAAGELLPGISVLLTLPRVVGLVFSAVLLGFCISAAARRRTGRAAAFGLGAIAFPVAFAATSLLATPAAWQVLHAAYRDAPPEKQRVFGQDIAANWLPFHEGMVLGDYYLLMRKWGVCHELWPQAACVRASSEREAEGIAREILADIARGS